MVPAWVLERYELTGALGRGAWTEVHAARDRVRGEPYAIKVLRPEYRDVERIRTRFETEARAMARLVHPRIVRIFDVGGALGQEPAIVMERLAGTLRDAVPSGGVAPADAVRLALEVLEGLAVAHEAGVVHRGISPENVLVDAEGHVKLSDFGTARLEDSQDLVTMTAEHLGSYFYMAPEQRRNARLVDARADVFGVGAVLYYLLTGRDPKALAIASMGDVEQDVHPAFRPILARATAEAPEARYADAEAMRRALLPA